MGSVYKKTVTRPVPANSQITERRRKATPKEFWKDPSQAIVLERIAKWRDKLGELRTGLVVVGEDGTDRVRVKSATYYCQFKDGNGRHQVLKTGCSDKQAAQSVLDDHLKRAQLVKAKVMTSDQARIADFQNDPLARHIDEYEEHLKARKVHPERIKTTKKRLIESSNGCNFRFLNELNADKLFCWLADQRDCETRQMSAVVYNGYIQIWVSFGNWCIGKRISGRRPSMNGDKRLLVNPFDGMGKLDEQADRRRKARALTEDELTRLLDAAKRRPVEDALTVRKGPRAGELIAKLDDDRRGKLERVGFERALIYKTAILTGLRLNEMRTLKVGDLSFGVIPFVRLQKGNEKNRSGSSLALRSDLALDLQKWCEGKEANDLVFSVPKGLLRILDRDLKTAGIPKIDSEGFVVHVHALRHSFGTHLSLAGITPRVAQAAMRHSNISLTMNAYTDARLLDTAAAIECLPSFPLGDSFVAQTVAQTPVLTAQNESVPDSFDDFEDESEKTKKPCKYRGICRVFDNRAGGIRTHDLYHPKVAR